MKHTNLQASGQAGDSVYPLDGGNNQTIVLSSNADFNIVVYPQNYLNTSDGSHQIGLSNVFVDTSYIVYTNMTNDQLGKGSASEIDLMGGQQSAPDSGTQIIITVDWRIDIPFGTYPDTYTSENITYEVV